MNDKIIIQGCNCLFFEPCRRSRLCLVRHFSNLLLKSLVVLLCCSMVLIVISFIAGAGNTLLTTRLKVALATHKSDNSCHRCVARVDC